jgi:hypothetical protein
MALVGELGLVVLLVLRANALEDEDGVVDGRRLDLHRLEATFERGVLLDVLAVFVERGRADALHLAAGERGLEDVRGVHRALGRTGADDGVQLVDEEDDVLGPRISSITALMRSSNWPRYLVPATIRARSRVMTASRARISGTLPLAISCARPSTMAVLPTPASPMSTGLFLVRRQRIWMTRSISFLRPMTGSMSPLRAISVRSRPKALSAGVFTRPSCLPGRRSAPNRRQERLSGVSSPELFLSRRTSDRVP